MTHAWQPAYEDFKQNLLPKLIKLGGFIGKKCAIDSDAKEIINYYSLLQRSWEPVSCMMIEKHLETFEENYREEISKILL